MKKMRMPAEQRRRIIVNAIVSVAKKRGSIAGLSSTDVASACAYPTSPQTVRYYFPRVEDMQLEVLSHDEGFRTEAKILGLIN